MRMKGKKFIFDLDDVYDLDHTLGGVIHAGLIKYKEVITSNKNPFPSTPERYLTRVDDFSYLEENDEDAWLKAHKRWLDDLDELIWRFSDEGMDYFPSECERGDEQGEHSRRRERALNIFADVFDSLWI